MRIEMKTFVGLAGGLLLALMTAPVAHGQAQHVRWDIINIVFGAPPTLTPGGVADAFARFPPPGAGLAMRIRLTGSGTFVAPASGGISSAVAGGGFWETYGTAGELTGSGTYRVTRLVFWQFTSPFAPGPIDLIGPNGANGNAFFRIQYSDGSEGVLGVGCHGPGAPNGIVEGVIASKGDVTYWDAGAPVAGVNTNRTTFHIE